MFALTSRLDPKKIPQFVNPLFIPPVLKPIVRRSGTREVHHYSVRMSEFKQQMLPQRYPKTTVYGFEGLIEDPVTGELRIFRSSPGPTFEATRGIPVRVQWINNLTKKHLFAVDPTLHWANPNQFPPPKPPFKPFPFGYARAQFPVPSVIHLHGGETRSDFDGNPEAWFTHMEKKKGAAFSTSLYTYLNRQQPTTLWYHDHTLGITRLNTAAGLSGFYLIRDPKNKIEPLLPQGNFEVPLVIQDRSFNTDASLFFPSLGVNPDVHPYWVQDFIGDTIMVNGRVWPKLNVKRRQYRFRILNGSNSRFYNLKLQHTGSNKAYPFIQIGTDGGFLRSPVKLKELLLAPAERADILIDFSPFDAGTKLIVTNDAIAPFPGGDPPDPDTTGKIMQFSIQGAPSIKPIRLPSKLNNIPKLVPNVPPKTFVLNVIQGDKGPLQLLLNGQPFRNPISEFPIIGSTVEWIFANTTAATHPLHIHLIQFQIVSRQRFNSMPYLKAWTKLNGTPPFDRQPKPLPVNSFLLGKPRKPDLNEQGWKDTIRVNPNEVTRFRLRFTPQDVNPNDAKPGVNLFSFNPLFGPGYVWHCHLLDHEDNDMMRPFQVRKK
ncbi:multicopper oxidase family protein [Marininema halotolerans]|uniref:Multicopper oxidase with three cupredoxin domains (Includes cell division protein FtsP and spore coat protein CotA) n=1 Tax=Marininema halotolerans TaxID=1155944 RepID=A0A1I6THR9_9BACL|nr:multicopper oxidase domain-containing protein [Marininema halotolerans]SFS88744.1 Multicopper oxidase with three cupredoxin domains (includes cell division protein FtsP and spore coat protein CotA) [Marininema halotolerans]